MVEKKQIVLLLAVLVLFAAPACAGPDMQEGIWEITTVTEIGGTAIQMPPQKHTQCLKNDDLVPKDPQAPQSCGIKDQRVNGDTVNWAMECDVDGVKTVSTGSVKYSGDSFSGRVDIVIDDTDMVIVNTMSGRRLGPCT